MFDVGTKLLLGFSVIVFCMIVISKCHHSYYTRCLNAADAKPCIHGTSFVKTFGTCACTTTDGVLEWSSPSGCNLE